MATVTTASTVTLRASAPPTLLDALAGTPCRGTVLARFPTALYVAVPRAFGVIAVLTRDAVRLPCGLQVPASSVQFPIDLLDGPVIVGDGVLRLGAVEVMCGRAISSRVARLPTPVPRLVATARAAVSPVDVTGAGRLLGRGEGLTPSGDDVLAGYLAAAAAYGLPARRLRAFVHREAPRRTTTLSAALLRHAANGEAIPQVAALLDALVGRRPLDAALDGLLAVGHTSGAALACGVVTAAGAAR